MTKNNYMNSFIQTKLKTYFLFAWYLSSFENKYMFHSRLLRIQIRLKPLYTPVPFPLATVNFSK